MSLTAAVLLVALLLLVAIVQLRGLGRSLHAIELRLALLRADVALARSEADIVPRSVLDALDDDIDALRETMGTEDVEVASAADVDKILGALGDIHRAVESVENEIGSVVLTLDAIEKSTRKRDPEYDDI